MARGGPRPGSGRPRGAATRRTRAVADRISSTDGISPLEIMVACMRELWAEAEAATSAVERVEWQLQACAVAEKCAPYVHARLSSVAATVRRVSSVKDLSDEELAALAAELGGGVDSEEPVPLPAGKRDLN